MTTIIGIDQSYTSTGYCVFKETALIACGTLTSNPKLDTFERAWNIATEIRDIVKIHRPKVVALEGLAFGMRGDATRDLAGLQYTIVNTLRYIDNHKVMVYSPNTVKKFATGKGNSKKDQMYECLPPNIQKYFVEDLGLKKSKGLYDVVDSYWIGLTAVNEYNKQ